METDPTIFLLSFCILLQIGTVALLAIRRPKPPQPNLEELQAMYSMLRANGKTIFEVKAIPRENFFIRTPKA